jgi:hypothetical protein
MSESNMTDKDDGSHVHEETNITNDNEKQVDPGFAENVARVQSLGSVRLRNATTGELVLVPTPTKDPNDPLVSFSPFAS